VEIRIPWAKLDNSQTITPVMDRLFKERGLDMSRHEVVKLEDDPDRKERVITIRLKSYFI
jgi:hypothetical protein